MPRLIFFLLGVMFLVAIFTTFRGRGRARPRPRFQDPVRSLPPDLSSGHSGNGKALVREGRAPEPSPPSLIRCQHCGAPDEAGPECSECGGTIS